jgi:WD40 repeat protein
MGKRQVDARYDAFISYSHTSRSTAVALGLQRGLERFARPWYRRRAARVFRDTTDLSVSPQLWADIQHALARSRWFVLLASPQAAGSRWVDKELGWWLEHRPAEQILPVLVEGTLCWDPDANQFDPTSTALPDRLRAAYRQEPLWLDLSRVPSGSESYSEPAMERAVASLAARLRGVDLDTVVGEHIRVGRRVRRIVLAVVSALVVLAAVAGAGWITASGQRDEANRAADVAASRNLVLESERLRTSQIDRALRLGIAADALDDSPRARSNLVAAMAGSRYAGTLPESASVVHALAFAPSGRLAVTAHQSGRAEVWDLTDPAKAAAVSTITPDSGPLFAVAFRPDGRVLALGGGDGTVSLWDISDPAHPTPGPRLPRLRTGVQAVAFDGSGSRLYVGSDNMRVDTDDGVRVWDVRKPTAPLLAAVIPTTSLVQQISVTRTDIVAIAGTSGVEMWSADGHSRLGLIDFQNTVYGAVPTPDGEHLATCDGDRSVRIFDISHPTTPTQVARLPDLANAALACALSRDGHALAVGVGDGTVETWDVTATDKPVMTARLPGHSEIVETVAYSADGLLLSGSGDGRALVWAPTVSTRATRSAVIEAGTGPVTSVGIGANGVAAFDVQTDPTEQGSSPSRTARLYRLPTAVADIQPADVARLWLSPDGRTLAIPGSSGPTTGGVTLWDVANPVRPVRSATVNVPGLGAEVVMWSADGATMLVSGQLSHRDDSGGAATLWDVSDPSNPVRLTARGLGDQAISAAAISPDGRTVSLAGADATVRTWDVSDPRAPRAFPGPVASHPAVVRAIAYSPSADVLATGSNDQTVALWTKTGSRLAVLQGTTNAISDIEFTKDGSLLAVLDEGGGVRLWDVSNAALPVRVDELLADAGNRADAIAWGVDGDELYVGRFNGKVETWDVRALRAMTADPRAVACALVGRGLDEAEWASAAPERAYRSTC